MEQRNDVRVVFTGDNVLYLKGLGASEVARLQEQLGRGLPYRHSHHVDDDEREMVIFPGSIAYMEITSANR